MVLAAAASAGDTVLLLDHLACGVEPEVRLVINADALNEEVVEVAGGARRQLSDTASVTIISGLQLDHATGEIVSIYSAGKVPLAPTSAGVSGGDGGGGGMMPIIAAAAGGAAFLVVVLFAVRRWRRRRRARDPYDPPQLRRKFTEDPEIGTASLRLSVCSKVSSASSTNVRSSQRSLASSIGSVFGFGSPKELALQKSAPARFGPEGFSGASPGMTANSSAGTCRTRIDPTGAPLQPHPPESPRERQLRFSPDEAPTDPSQSSSAPSNRPASGHSARTRRFSWAAGDISAEDLEPSPRDAVPTCERGPSFARAPSFRGGVWRLARSRSRDMPKSPRRKDSELAELPVASPRELPGSATEIPGLTSVTLGPPQLSRIDTIALDSGTVEEPQKRSRWRKTTNNQAEPHAGVEAPAECPAELSVQPIPELHRAPSSRLMRALSRGGIWASCSSEGSFRRQSIATSDLSAEDVEPPPPVPPRPPTREASTPGGAFARFPSFKRGLSKRGASFSRRGAADPDAADVGTAASCDFSAAAQLPHLPDSPPALRTGRSFRSLMRLTFKSGGVAETAGPPRLSHVGSTDMVMLEVDGEDSTKSAKRVTSPRSTASTPRKHRAAPSHPTTACRPTTACAPATAQLMSDAEREEREAERLRREELVQQRRDEDEVARREAAQQAEASRQAAKERADKEAAKEQADKEGLRDARQQRIRERTASVKVGAHAKVDTRGDGNGRGKLVDLGRMSGVDAEHKVDTRRDGTDNGKGKLVDLGRMASVKGVAKVDARRDSQDDDDDKVVDMGEVKKYKERPRYMVAQRESNTRSSQPPRCLRSAD